MCSVDDALLGTLIGEVEFCEREGVGLKAIWAIIVVVEMRTTVNDSIIQIFLGNSGFNLNTRI